MTKKMAVLIILTAAVFAIAGCAKKLLPSAPAERPMISGQDFKAEQSSNNFAIDLYNRYKQSDDNIFFSPFSISTALSMVYEGAAGQTADEMRSVLYLTADNNARWAGISALIDFINKPVKEYEFVTANDIWCERTYSLLSSYTGIVSSYYGAQAFSADFIGAPEASRSAINARVETLTNGKIQTLMGEGTITSDTRVVLTNAVYFKADWMSQFDPDKTFPRNFTLSDGSVKVTDTMMQSIQLKIENFAGAAQVVELPYVQDELSMYIFLPAQGQMAALESALTAPALAAWLGSRNDSGASVIDLYLPKFKFTISYDMGGTLAAMGMPAVFTPAADLSGIDGTRNLSVSAVVHKAFVAVDEKGTEAAAATGVVVGVTSVPMPNPEFRVDRPFIFMICDNTKNTIIFMGRINEPVTE